MHIFVKHSQVALVIKNPPANARGIRDMGSKPGCKDPLEMGRAPHCSILPWRILCTEEPGVFYGVAKNRIWLKWLSTHSCSKYLLQFKGQFSSVQSLSRVWLFATPWTSAHGLPVHHRLPESTHLCPSSWWCHPAISSSVLPFSSCPQALPASGSFPMSQLFTSGGQSIGVSASASVLPMNTQDWSPLGWTGWISLRSKGLSAVFSNITVQKHQFFVTQLFSQSNSHIHTWPLEKP